MRHHPFDLDPHCSPEVQEILDDRNLALDAHIQSQFMAAEAQRFARMATTGVKSEPTDIHDEQLRLRTNAFVNAMDSCIWRRQLEASHAWRYLESSRLAQFEDRLFKHLPEFSAFEHAVWMPRLNGMVNDFVADRALDLFERLEPEYQALGVTGFSQKYTLSYAPNDRGRGLGLDLFMTNLTQIMHFLDGLELPDYNESFHKHYMMLVGSQTNEFVSKFVRFKIKHNGDVELWIQPEFLLKLNSMLFPKLRRALGYHPF